MEQKQHTQNLFWLTRLLIWSNFHFPSILPRLKVNLALSLVTSFISELKKNNYFFILIYAGLAFKVPIPTLEADEKNKFAPYSSSLRVISW